MIRSQQNAFLRLNFRRARRQDVPAIVSMLADDDLGKTREFPESAVVTEGYYEAFERIDHDPNQFLCVVEKGSQVVGTLQLTLIPGLSRGGALRGQIEAVRVLGSRRGEGLGKALLGWAIEHCRAQACALVQLTSDRTRSEAHRFYEELGFEPSHIGYKLSLR